MSKPLRKAGFVTLTLGALGCGEPAQPDLVAPQELFKSDTVAVDSAKGAEWKKFLDAKELHRAWAPPPDSPWRPFHKPTLVASIAAVQSAAMPIRNALMPPAEEEAARFVASADLSDAAVFVDLIGEESVAWAAALRPKGLVPVLTINNWPHQFGVLHLERPLGALLYYADEVAKVPPAADARPVFILERSRLGQKGLNPQPRQFDNRYYHARTDFPGAVLLKSKGVSKIYYINPRGVTPGCEEDDLAEYFTELWNAGIQFTYVKPGTVRNELALVTPAPRETIFTTPAMQTYDSTPASSSSSSRTHHHYYRPYRHYHDWHYSYWRRSGGAWGGYGSSGYDSSRPVTGTGTGTGTTTTGSGKTTTTGSSGSRSSGGGFSS